MKKEFKIILFSVIIVLIDQIIKYIVKTNLNLFESIKVTDFFKITYVENTGGAFSILSGNVFLFVITGILCLVLFYIFFIKNKSLKNIDIILYSIFIGGIIGNMIDRIINKSVIDYLDFKFFNFPIFNFADICIVISVLLILLFRGEKHDNK